MELDPLTGEQTGDFTACTDNCATCIYSSDFCLSCVTGYTLTGSRCHRSIFLSATVLLGPGTTNNSIFTDSDSAQMQLYKIIRSLNRLGAGIFATLPTAFTNGNTDWRKVLKFTSFKTGSVQAGLDVNSEGYTDSSTAST